MADGNAGIVALAALLDSAPELLQSQLQPQDLALYLQSLRDDLLRPLRFKVAAIQGRDDHHHHFHVAALQTQGLAAVCGSLLNAHA